MPKKRFPLGNRQRFRCGLEPQVTMLEILDREQGKQNIFCKDKPLRLLEILPQNKEQISANNCQTTTKNPKQETVKMLKLRKVEEGKGLSWGDWVERRLSESLGNPMNKYLSFFSSQNQISNPRCENMSVFCQKNWKVIGKGFYCLCGRFCFGRPQWQNANHILTMKWQPYTIKNGESTDRTHTATTSMNNILVGLGPKNQIILIFWQTTFGEQICSELAIKFIKLECVATLGRVEVLAKCLLIVPQNVSGLWSHERIPLSSGPALREKCLGKVHRELTWWLWHRKLPWMVVWWCIVARGEHGKRRRSMPNHSSRVWQAGRVHARTDKRGVASFYLKVPVKFQPGEFQC